MKSILFVIAHQDDLAFGMGGTAYLLKDRFKLHVACLCRVVREPPDGDAYNIRMRGQQAHCRSTFYRRDEDISHAEGFKTLRPLTSSRECILFGLGAPEEK